MKVFGDLPLRWKMAATIAIAFSLFVVAIVTAVNGLVETRNGFTQFIDQDNALAESVADTYAQGLQLGQAVRNIILDPSNKTAYANLEAADGQLAKALNTGLALAKTDPETFKVLAGISELRSKQKSIQQSVVKLAQDNQGLAIQMLNKEETPLWRQMRSALLELMKLKSGQVSTQRTQMVSYTSNVVWLSVGLGAVALVGGLLLMVWLAKSITRQLGGEPASAVDVANKIAAGNLCFDIQVTARDESSLFSAMQRMRDGLVKMVGEVRASAEAIGSGTKQIASGNSDLSQRTEEQASSLEETASSMEELTSTVKQNAENARRANELTISASAIAVKGGEVVNQVVGTMSSISESSGRIVDIIGVIDGIAFQTNILALNAAVEAARAGEQGRGFAVVASEVRNLAQRSAVAAKEIKALIADSVEKVGAGTRLVDEAGKTMGEIVDSVRQVTDIMAGITAASQEQSAGIAQVNQAVAQMDHVTQQNAALVEEAAAAAESLQEQAYQLAQAVAAFKLESPEGVAAHAQRTPAPTEAPRRAERAQKVERQRAERARAAMA